jgi:TonB family protein
LFVKKKIVTIIVLSLAVLIQASAAATSESEETVSAHWLAQSAQSPPSQEPPAQTASSLPSDSTQLEVISAPQPDYPLEAAAKGLQGKVWIKLHISETGDVVGTDIISGDPALAQAAANAMKLWKFKPFFKDGKPVKVSRNVPYEFILKGKVTDPCAAVEAISRMNLAHHPPQIPQTVAEGWLIHKVEPVYPVAAKTKRLQGKVILQAIIGKDGTTHDEKSLCGPPEFIQACIDAIRKWRFRPYLLEGDPVEVMTTITFNFHLY